MKSFLKMMGSGRRLLKHSRSRYSWFDRKLQQAKYPMYFYFISANLAVYLSWNFYLLSKNFFYKHFVLSRDNLWQGRHHTLITHAFAHQGLFSLLSNMALIYYVGRRVEMLFGSKMFLQLYLIGILSGALVKLMFPRDRYVGVIGASNVGSALFSYYYMSFLFSPANVGGFSAVFNTRNIALLLLFASFLCNRGTNDIGHSGYMGGILGGISLFFLKRY